MIQNFVYTSLLVLVWITACRLSVSCISETAHVLYTVGLGGKHTEALWRQDLCQEHLCSFLSHSWSRPGWDLDAALMSHGLIKPKWAVISIFSISSPLGSASANQAAWRWCYMAWLMCVFGGTPIQTGIRWPRDPGQCSVPWAPVFQLSTVALCGAETACQLSDDSAQLQCSSSCLEWSDWMVCCKVK